MSASWLIDMLNAIDLDDQILNITLPLETNRTADIQFWMTDPLGLKQIICDIKEHGKYLHSYVKYPDQANCVGPIFKHGF